MTFSDIGALNAKSTMLSNGLTAMEFTAVSDGRELDAVRMIRARLALGLSDAKAMVAAAKMNVNGFVGLTLGVM